MHLGASQRGRVHVCENRRIAVALSLCGSVAPWLRGSEQVPGQALYIRARSPVQMRTLSLLLLRRVGLLAVDRARARGFQREVCALRGRRERRECQSRLGLAGPPPRLPRMPMCQHLAACQESCQEARLEARLEARTMLAYQHAAHMDRARRRMQRSVLCSLAASMQGGSAGAPDAPGAPNATGNVVLAHVHGGDI